MGHIVHATGDMEKQPPSHTHTHTHTHRDVKIRTDRSETETPTYTHTPAACIRSPSPFAGETITVAPAGLGRRPSVPPSVVEREPE